jgi:AraC-like DNA-binding protein
MVGAASNSERSGDGLAGPDQGGRGATDAAVHRFRSRDLDETRAFIGQFGHHTRVPHGRDPFGYEFVAAVSRRIVAAHMHVSVRQTMRAAANAPTLLLPLRPGDTYSLGRKALHTDPSKAILLATGHEYSLHGPAGACVGLRIDEDLLCREISARMRGRSQALLLTSVEIPMDAGRLAAFRSIYDRMFAAARGDHPSGSSGNVDTLEVEVASWVSGLVIERAGARAASAGSFQRIERLERWLDAHLGEDISLERLCAVAGVRGRALQKLMMARFGQSPLERVNARRLAAVRERLLKSNSGVVISMVALDCGFTHLGRFSAVYRQAYGELPSETLAAARSRPDERGNLPA